MQLYIVLALLAFMIISFVIHKIPFGVTAMICCVMLVVTGFYTPVEAFSGFSNQNIILLAPMFALSAAFGKTSLLKKIQNQMTILKGKRGYLLLAAMFAFLAVLAAFIPTTAMMTIALMFITALGDTGDITPTTITIPALSVLSVWCAVLPVGLGSTVFAQNNVLYEGIVTNENQLLQFLDYAKVAVIPSLICTIYAVFAYKLMPKKSNYSMGDIREAKEQAPISKRDETIIYVVFVIVMLSLFFGTQIGNLMYVMPAIGVIVLLVTKAMSVKDTVGAMTQDAIWMAAGVLVMANALGDSGAGAIIGNFILTILGGNPNSIMVLFVFAIVTTVMTTFMSNAATRNVLIPIAASTCLAAGWDPRGVVCIVFFCSNIAVAFPSGSPACGIAYGVGGYKITQTLKYTLPYVILAIIAVVITANLAFPVYG